jgi:hypothetical protein
MNSVQTECFVKVWKRDCCVVSSYGAALFKRQETKEIYVTAYNGVGICKGHSCDDAEYTSICSL